MQGRGRFVPARTSPAGRTRTALEGAIATRNRSADRVDQALRVTPRAVTLATLGILAVGAVVLWFVLRGSSARERAMNSLAVGSDSTQVRGALGAPAGNCATGSLEHLRAHLPEDMPAAQVEGTLDDLRRRTARRWIYPSGGESASCTAGRDATEIGLDRTGRVLWFVSVTGETLVELPEAGTTGAP